MDPDEVNEDIIEHVEQCDYCKHAFEVEDIKEGSILPPRRHYNPVPVLLAVAAILPGLVNGTASGMLASANALPPIDWWRLFQAELLRVGAIIGVGLLLVCVLWALIKPMRAIFRFAAVAGVGLTLFTTGAYGVAEWREAQISRRLDKAFLSHRWITFESTSFDPQTNPDPPLEVLTKELRWLHDQGNFDGLITFTFTPNLIEAAQAAGFRAIIVGIYVGPDGVKPAEKIAEVIAYERETQAAGDNRIVGYCLGHNVSVSVPLSSLAGWMDELRRGSGKPVTSTFPLVNYLGERGRTARAMGDWYFPDVHANWHFGTTPEKAYEQTQRAVEEATVLADKPVMLKMVSYPSGPASLPGLTPEAQEQFYRAITQNLYLPPGMHMSVFAGADLPWKSKGADRRSQFAPSEEHVGLFKANGDPKPALKIVSGGDWPVQSRP